MNLLFDTSVWIDDLRHGALRFILPRVRGKHFLWVDSIAVAELLAGCGTRRHRRIVERLLSPFERAGRIVTPNPRDFHRAGDALSKLRGSGTTLKNPGAALLDAVQASDAARMGALLVTANIADFTQLARYIPVTVQSFDDFRRSL